MENTERKCKCGNRFFPYQKAQKRCVYCILKEEPPLPNDDATRGYRTDFVEWFIYHWHKIRLAGAKMKGVTLEWDDGISEFAENGERKRDAE